MTIENVLDSFVSSKEPGAIVLRGPWGVGKTYFWQHQIAAHLLSKPWEKRYSYVSLFGLNSLSELKVALAVATEEFDRDARNAKRLSQWWTKWFWQAWRWTSDVLPAVLRTGAGLSKLFDKVGFYLVRGRIICFDDIERHGNGLDLKDFLGLVSYLTEQRNCRVVVILNSGQLGSEQEVWDQHREKVFHGEIKFEPSLSQTIELGLADDADEQWYPFLYAAFEELAVSNIRLVARAARFMHLAMATTNGEPIRDQTAASIARVVAMLVYSIHGRGAGGPPLERVLKRDLLNTAYGAKDGDQRTTQQIDWDRVITGYGLHLYRSMDHALLAMVEAGYPDEETLGAAIREVECNADMQSRKEAWHNAWRLYHDTVAENGDAIVEAFEKTWPGVSDTEHASNLQSTARLLRMLGRPDLATKFIDEWVRQRSAGRFNELDDRELHLFRKIEDPELLAAVARASAQAHLNLDVQTAFGMMRESHGFPQAAIQALGEATVEDLVEVVDATVGEDLSPTIRRIVELGSTHGNPAWVSASQKMLEACRLIAARSPLAADRMMNWVGVDARGPDDETSGPGAQT